MGHEVSADDLQARNQNGHFQREVCLQLRLQMLGPAAWRNLPTVAICLGFLLQGASPRQDLGWASGCIGVKALGDTSSTSWWLPWRNWFEENFLIS